MYRPRPRRPSRGSLLRRNHAAPPPPSVISAMLTRLISYKSERASEPVDPPLHARHMHDYTLACDSYVSASVLSASLVRAGRQPRLRGRKPPFPSTTGVSSVSLITPTSVATRSNVPLLPFLAPLADADDGPRRQLRGGSIYKSRITLALSRESWGERSHARLLCA